MSYDDDMSSSEQVSTVNPVQTNIGLRHPHDGVRDQRPGVRERPSVEDDRYVAFARRIVRGLGKRAGRNLDILQELSDLRDLADQMTAEAVQALRTDGDDPASWADIGRALGIARQSAQQRFGGSGSRVAGGQPGNLR